MNLWVQLADFAFCAFISLGVYALLVHIIIYAIFTSCRVFIVLCCCCSCGVMRSPGIHGVHAKARWRPNPGHGFDGEASVSPADSCARKCEICVAHLAGIFDVQPCGMLMFGTQHTASVPNTRTRASDNVSPVTWPGTYEKRRHRRSFCVRLIRIV